MRTLLRLAMGVLLAELTFGHSTHAVVTSAPGGGEGGQSAGATAPMQAGWKLGRPINFQNLTVFPVLGDGSLDTGNFITLDEGLRTGKVFITEIGAHGRTRRLRAGRQASDNAEVNKLMLTNRSGKTLVLIAGEMVVGGKQDRIVGHDCLMASNNTPVPLDVFCVEPGRWEAGAFGQSRSAEQTNARSQGNVTDSAVRLSGDLSFVTVAGAMAPPKVRSKAQAAKNQGGVWEEVAKTARDNKTSSSTGKLNAVYENTQVKTRLEDYRRAFANKLSDQDIIGVVVVVGGKLRSADVFATHSLFGIYWPKLLKSYCLEALSAGKPATETVDLAAAEAFLSRAEGARSTNGNGPLYRLVEHQSDKDASFELVNTSKPTSELIHFNRVSKE